MKTKIILIVLIILCFIPTAVAYGSYKQTQNAPVDEKTALTISIVDLNDKRFDLVKEKEDDEACRLIALFMKMNQNASAIAALPDSLRAEKPFTVTVSASADKEETYHYYFSTDPTTNYYVTADSKVYHIAEADAKAFITTPYAESLYKTSALPSLTLADTYAVVPDSAVWQYKNYTGAYVDSDTSGMVAAGEEYFELDGGFSLKFDTTPDYFNVKITDEDGNVVFDDFYDKLGTLTFTENTNITVDVLARWYEDASRSFCGELNYTFSSLVTSPAEFYLGMESVERGCFVAITGKNVTNPDKIGFTSNIPNGAVPKFYKDGDYVVGLLPVDITTEAGTYLLTFTYGGSSQVTNLTVDDKTIGISHVSVDTAVLNKYRTTATVSAFQNTAAEIMSKSVNKRYFEGAFLEGPDDTTGLLRGFGRNVIINNDETNTYRNNGVDYSAMAGTAVYACNAGQVVFSGSTDYTGNMIVIDHGLGLKTWYYNLGSCDVKVGDVVAKGDTIGTCGNTGFAAMASGVHVAMSVGDRFVCPYDTWADSTTAGYVKIYGIAP